MAFTSFNESAGSPVYQIGIDRSKATRTGRIPWADIGSLFTELFSGEVSISLPGYPQMRASGLHIEPFIGDKEKPTAPITSDLTLVSLNEYAFAKVKIEYTTEVNGDLGSGSSGTWNGVDPVALLSHRWSAGGQFVTIDSSPFEWKDATTAADGDVPDKVKLGRFIATQEHQVTWHRVPKPPFDTIRDSISKVNDREIIFETGTVQPETLLFLGAELQRDVLTTGALAWQLTYKFSERSVPLAVTSYIGNNSSNAVMTVGGWNHYLRTDGIDEEKYGFYRIGSKSSLTAGADDPIFELSNHLDLFVQTP